MKCPNCSQTIADDASMCLWCGSPVGLVPGQPVPVYGRAQSAAAAAGASPIVPPASAQSAVPPAAIPPGAVPPQSVPPGGAGFGGGPGGLPPGAPPPIPPVGGPGGLSSSGLVARVKAILLTPKTEWPVIAAEPTPVQPTLLYYVLPLAGFAALMVLVHLSLIGINIPFVGLYRQPIWAGLLAAVWSLVATAIGLGVLTFLITVFAPTFGGAKDTRQALRTAAYAYTPSWVASIATIVPFLGVLIQIVAGCYAIYLLYLGLPPMMRSAREKAAGYTAAVVICSIVIMLVVGGIASVVGIGSMAMMGGLGSRHASTSSTTDREQGAAILGAAIGNAVGSDDQGKRDLSRALDNLVKAGEDAERQAKAMPPPNADATSPTQQAAASTAAGAPDVATATGNLIGALGTAAGGTRAADTVDFHSLKDMLPIDVGSLHRTSAEGGSQEVMGLKSASAKGSYRGDANQSANIEIVDMAGAGGLVALAARMEAKTEREGDDGYEKSVKVGGHTVREKFVNAGQHGEIDATIGKRFQITVSGYGMPMGDLEKVFASIDVSKLESMKDASK